MTAKISLLFILLTSAGIKKGQSPANYDFPKPKGWNTEKFAMPIDFAKSIPFKGTEELRFTPGWGNNKTDEYWAYDFLWFVDGMPSLSKGDLDKYMIDYYTGLYLSNLKNKTAAPSNFTKAHFKKATVQVNDKQTFEGTITTLDFLTSQPITFNVKVHVRHYPEVQHTAILFEISPQDYKNVVWDSLDGVANGFQLKK
jgi:hypothetical protein